MTTKLNLRCVGGGYRLDLLGVRCPACKMAALISVASKLPWIGEERRCSNCGAIINRHGDLFVPGGDDQ